MKQLLFILWIGVFSLQSSAQEALLLGAVIPNGNVKMKDISGALTTLNEVRSTNGLLVMFSCNTCPYVIRNQSRTNEICLMALNKNIGVILINSNEENRTSGDSYQDMQAYAKEQGYKWHYVVDSHNEIANAFAANRTPECYLFDGNGKLVYHGAIDNSPTDITNVKRVHVQEAINEMLSGKDVTIKKSRSVGCTIRRKAE